MNIFFLIPWWARLAALAALCLALIGYGWVKGANANQVKFDKYVAKQNIELLAAINRAGERTRTLQSKKDEALNVAALKTQEKSRALARATATGDGLRDDLDAAKRSRDLSEYSITACRADLATRDELLGSMDRAGRGMAEKAQGHAIDAAACLSAWPK